MAQRSAGFLPGFTDSEWPVSGTFRLPANPESAKLARDLVREQLAGSPDSVIEVAVLLVSELVSNAVRYGTSPPLMRIEVDGRGVRIGIQDQSPEPPQLKADSADADSGRGLFLVDALAIAWGWSLTPDGKRVWFTL